MAGDFLKWIKGFAKKREVVLMSGILGEPRQMTATRCFEVFEWCDDNITEGDFDESGHAHVTLGANAKSLIDSIAEVSGFADAMSAAGWLNVRSGSLTFPNFSRHNGEPAKQRALTNARQQRKRQRDKAVLSHAHRDNGVTSKEKKREELDTNVSNPYSPQFELFWVAFPKGRKQSKGKAWAAWRKSIKQCSPEVLIAAATEYAASNEGRGRFVKMPSSWLNQECWNDDRTSWARNQSEPATNLQRKQDETDEVFARMRKRMNRRDSTPLLESEEQI